MAQYPSWLHVTTQASSYETCVPQVHTTVSGSQGNNSTLSFIMPGVWKVREWKLLTKNVKYDIFIIFARWQDVVWDLF